MRKSQKLLAAFSLLGILLLGGGSLFAQNRSCQGTVKDAQGEPVISASVLIKDAPVSTGTVTDMDGNFVQPNAKVGDVLVVSSIGYETVEVTWNGSPLTVVLRDDYNVLDEVVVTGYGGTQLRSKLTNSIAKVDEKALTVGTFTNAASSLAGAVSGLRVIQTSGNPSAAPSIVLRGGTNLDGSGSPLVVVDGQLRDDMGEINNDDIESIDVLKDAGATALYGARASNGVILITTKRGKVGTSEIRFKAKAAFNFMNQPFEYCDAGDYIYWMRSAYNNSHWANKATLSAVYPYGLGQTEVTNSTVWNILRKTDANSYLLQKGWSEMTDPVDGATKILYKSTNPADYNINNPTLTQDYTVSMSGGNDKGRYYASIGYNDAKGLPVSTFYKRLSFLFNGSYNLNRWLTSNSSVNFVRALYRDMPGSFSGAGTGYDGYYFGRIMGTPPTVRFEDEDGNPLFGNSRSDGNQNYQPEKYIRDNENNKLTLSQGFSAKLSRTLTFNVNATWYYDQYVNEAFNKDLQNNQAGTAWVRTRSSSASYSRYFNQTYNATLQYKNTFADIHNVDVMVGAEAYDRIYKAFSAQGQEAATDDFQDLALTSKEENKRNIDSSHSQYRISSFFGRLNYDLAGKYLASFTFREDGYSALLDNRWGFFPGVSLGWIFGQEDFIKNTMPVLSFGKLRASYGVNGNASGIGAYELQGAYSAQTAYDGSVGFLIGTLPNPSLRWEKTTTFEVGADLSFWQNRLNANFTFYNRLTDDKYAALKLPQTTGFSSVTNNNGQFRNRGIELELSGKIIQNRDWRWVASANISYNKNIIVKLPDNGLPRNRQDGVELYTGNGNETEWYGGYQEGQEPGIVYGYVVEKMARSESDFPAGYYVTSGHWNGFWQYAPADYDKLANKSNAVRLQGGDFIYKDINGDGHIDVHDQAVLGNTIPHWTGGFNTTLSWKGLSLYARFDYALGFYLQDWYNSNGMVWMLGCMQGTYNMPTLVKDTWTPENPNATFPRYVFADQLGPGNYYKLNSFWTHRADYLAIREISLSYAFPKALMDKIRCKGLTLSVTGQNLGYITAAKWVASPETGGTRGVGYGLPRTILFGVDVTF